MNYRSAAIVFVVFQALLLVMLSEQYIVLLLTPIMLGLSFTLPPSYRLSRRRHLAWLLVFLVILLALRARSIWIAEDAHVIFKFFAEYLIIAQLLEFFRNRRGVLADYFPGLGIITMACTFAQMQSGLRREAIEILSASVALFAIALLRPAVAGHRGENESEAAGKLDGDVLKETIPAKKRTTLVVLAFLIVVLGWILSDVLHKARPHALRLLVHVSDRQRSNESEVRPYVGGGGLHHVRNQKLNDPNGIALSIRSEKPPGYMRGSVYDRYANGYWIRQGGRIKIHERTSNHSLEIGDDQSVFQIAETLSPPLEKLVVSSDPRRGEHIFMPLGTQVVAGEARYVKENWHGSIQEGLSNKKPYTLLVSSDATATVSSRYRDHMTHLRYDVHQDEIRQLANQVFRGCRTTKDKIVAVERFFDEQFHYTDAGGTDENLGEYSVVAAFLLERRSAHCEFFATGACVLLRHHGIPCRFVVGYRVYDLNDAEEVYIAKNADAHAWAEAYDEQSRSWVTVEATPGILGPYEEPGRMRFARRRDEIEQETQVQAHGGGLGGDSWFQTALFWEALNLIRRQVLIPIAVLIISLVVIYRRHQRQHKQFGVVSAPPKQLRQANAVARRLGLVREPSETLHQFALRVMPADSSEDNAGLKRQLADWYMAYASVRYTSEANAAMKQIESPPRFRRPARRLRS